MALALAKEIRMKFELKHTFDHPVDVVTREFLNPALFPHLQANMPKTMVAIAPVECTDQGGTVTRKTRYKPQPLIKSIGPKKVTPEMMAWVEESTFDKAARVLKFKNVPDSGRLRSLLVNEGTITFKDVGGKTERTVSGELKVKVFLLGSIAEKIIYKNAQEILNEEAAAFKTWLADKK